MFFWRLAVGDWCGAFLSKVRINEQSPRIAGRLLVKRLLAFWVFVSIT